MIVLLCVAMASTGVVTWAITQKDTELEEETVVEINDESENTLKANLSGFYPGSEQEYVVKLTGDGSEYSVTLKFRNDNENGRLEEYLTVKIEANGNVIEKPLSEALDGEEISLGKGISEIKIIYAMSEETGNEAQGTTANFYIDITAKNIDG